MNARWWQPMHDADGALSGARCGLCVHACRIGIGKSGQCGARMCTEEGLTSPYLGRFSSLAVDPIEKKPLYHWQPGTRILSLGSLGCTMRCPFCQNWQIAHPTGPVPLTDVSIQDLVRMATQHGLTSVAYTYNEPTLQAEYILEAAPLLRKAGIATVLVTNGQISPAPLAELAPWIAAANVDVKAFTPKAYAAMGGSLARVKETVETLVRAGTHVELTTLVVPGISDSPEAIMAMVDWIAGLSPDIPLHLSRYFPAHTFTAPATDPDLLRRFASLAEKKLRHVHLGNLR